MKKQFAFISALAVLSLSSLEAASFPQGYGPTTIQPSFSNHIAIADETTTTTKDQELSNKIEKALHGNTLTKNYPTVHFDVKNSRVILTGTLQNEEDKKNVAEKIRGIDGISGIQNNITIDKNLKEAAINAKHKNATKDSLSQIPHVSYNTTADKRIADTIHKQISANLSGAKQLTIDVNYGTVTVSGLVPNPQSKTQLIGKIRNINGVLAVQDNLLLKDSAHTKNIPQPANANSTTKTTIKSDNSASNANDDDDDDDDDDDNDDDDDATSSASVKPSETSKSPPANATPTPRP